MMKINLLKTGLFFMALSGVYGCEPNEEENIAPNTINAVAEINLVGEYEKITFDNFTKLQNGFLGSVKSDKNTGPILVTAFKRTAANTYGTANVANIFNSGQKGPVGNNVDDILTPHKDFGGWGVGEGGKKTSSFANNLAQGNLMIINRSDQATTAYDYDSGGKMFFDFSSLGTATLKSVTIMDIDSYEEGSKVILYGANSTVLKEIMMKVSGSNGKQILNLGNTRGVLKMEIIMGPAGISPNKSLSGSGAIDDIVFLRDGAYGCTFTQGYWKTHASGKKYDAIWGNLPNQTFYGSGLSYLNLMNSAPKNGNAYVILAHQYIAAYLNLKTASTTPEVSAVMAKALEYFSAKANNKYANTISAPSTTVTRNDLIKWADILTQYNEGVVGPGHCK